MFAQKLSEAWSVPVTVENIPGAGGSVGGERVAKSPPDGYTLYWGANGAMTINPSLLPNPSFDPQRDLAPIARLLVSPSILAVNNDVPAKTRRRADRARQGAARQALLCEPRHRNAAAHRRRSVQGASSASTSCTFPIAARTSPT